MFDYIKLNKLDRFKCYIIIMYILCMYVHCTLYISVGRVWTGAPASYVLLVLHNTFYYRTQGHIKDKQNIKEEEEHRATYSHHVLYSVRGEKHT